MDTGQKSRTSSMTILGHLDDDRWGNHTARVLVVLPLQTKH